MNSQAYFEDIQQRIKEELSLARQSIVVAVAWFTDPELFEMLCKHAEHGVGISLLVINDRINKGPKGLDFEKLRGLGGLVYLIGSGSDRDVIMHNKFCVIDGETVITGSYNWTRKAQRNDENIIIIKDCGDFAAEFVCEFHDLIEKYVSKNSANYNSIIKRLEILKNIIELQDEDDIANQITKLKKLLSTKSQQDSLVEAAAAIINSIENKAYDDAVRLIQNYLDKLRTPAVWIDPELPSLKLEMRVLELEICTLQDERADMERLIKDFESLHNIELGQIILEILLLRRTITQSEATENPQDKKKQEQFQEATGDYEAYRHGYEEEKLKPHYELTPEQKREIKDKYRKASKLCHPDAVSQDYAIAAAEMFNKLSEAYTSNNLETVCQILEHLEVGVPFEPKHTAVKEMQKLKSEVLELRSSIRSLVVSIAAMKNSNTYKILVGINDWQEYFSTTKQSLLQELESLKEQWKKTIPN